jgi:transposase
MGGRTLASGSSGGEGTRRKRVRRRFSVEEKMRIVELASAPNASVAGVALAHGVNANLVFKWRRQSRAGRLGQQGAAVQLVPVTLRPADAEPAPAEAESPAVAMSAAAQGPDRQVSGGVIQLQLGKARLRIEGRADPATLRVVLEALQG